MNPLSFSRPQYTPTLCRVAAISLLLPLHATRATSCGIGGLSTGMASTPTDPSKRARTDEQESGQATPIVRSDLAALLEVQRVEIAEASAASTHKLLLKYDEIQKQKFAVIDSKILSLQKMHATQQREIEELRHSIATNANDAADIRKKLVTAAHVTADPDFDHQWDREPDRSVLSIGTPDLVSKEELTKSLQPWLDRLELVSQPWQVLGPTMGRNFTIAFDTNEHGVGALRAAKANDLLFNKEAKEWEKLYVPDPEGKALQIYISPDNSPKVRREQTLCKRLVTAIVHVHPDLKDKVYFNRRARNVCIRRKAVAKIEATSFEVFTPLWVYEQVAKSGLDKEAIVEHFKSITGLAPEEVYRV